MAIHKEIKLDCEKILNLYCMEYDIFEAGRIKTATYRRLVFI